MFGIDPVLLGQPRELFVHPREVDEHRAVAEPAERSERIRASAVMETAGLPPVTRAPGTELGIETEAPDHAAKRRMRLVDRLATDVDPQAPIERHPRIAAVQRVHPTADALARLEHQYVPTLIA